MVDHTQYSSRAVQAFITLNEEYHLSDVECLDAPDDVPSGSHRSLDVPGLGRCTYAWTEGRQQ